MSDRPVNTVATLPARGAPPPLRRRTLLVMTEDAVVPHPLPARGAVTLGRGRDADLRVDQPSLSRRHLRIDLDDQRLTVTDLDSANGTTLRGVRLPAGVAVEVAANEPLGAGDVTLVIQELRAVASAPGAPAAAAPSGRLTGPRVDPIILDAAMQRLHGVATRVARGTIAVLLVGETGTGKEVLAELVHRASPRAAGPLVRINCAALSESLVESELFGHERGAFTGAQRDRPGLLEAADGGTAFLDEIGEVPLPVQAKLLRVLEEGQLMRVGASAPRAIDVRFVAATNRDLEAEIDAGRFRRDLYFRLSGAVLAIPPLRERRAELEPLAQRFAAEAARGVGRPAPRLSAAALDALHRHAWPGNVRELRNVIERAVLLADGATLEVEHLALDAPAAAASAPEGAAARAPGPAPGAPLAEQLAALEHQRILDALEQSGGNQTRAAELLGMPRRTLIKRLEQYGVRRPRKGK